MSCSPLSLAVSFLNGNISYIEHLLSTDILVMSLPDIEKIIDIAVRAKDFKLIEILLHKYPHIKDNLVHVLISMNATNLLLWLFQQNMVDIKSLSVVKGLATACKERKYDIMDILLQHGADV